MRSKHELEETWVWCKNEELSCPKKFYFFMELFVLLAIDQKNRRCSEKNKLLLRSRYCTKVRVGVKQVFGRIEKKEETLKNDLFWVECRSSCWGRRCGRRRCCCSCCCRRRCCRCCCCTVANTSLWGLRELNKAVTRMCVLCFYHYSLFTPPCINTQSLSHSHTHTHTHHTHTDSLTLLQPAHTGSGVKSGGWCLPPMRAGHPIEQMTAISVGNDEDSQRSTSSTPPWRRTSSRTPTSTTATSADAAEYLTKWNSLVSHRS